MSKRSLQHLFFKYFRFTMIEIITYENSKKSDSLLNGNLHETAIECYSTLYLKRFVVVYIIICIIY